MTAGANEVNATDSYLDAAIHGKNGKNCWDIYSDCSFSILGLIDNVNSI